MTGEASCTAAGVRTFTCARCGQTRTETIPMLDHAWDGGRVADAPTCTAEGIRIYTCARCGATYMETLPLLGHTPAAIPDVPATCTSGGKTGGTRCAVCGIVIQAQTVIAATGHQFGPGYYAVAPTCAQEGIFRHECAVCGQRRDESLGFGSHAGDAGTVTQEPGYLNPGQITYTCTVCGETRTEETPALEGGEETVFGALSGWTPEIPRGAMEEALGSISDILQIPEPDGTPLRIVTQPAGGLYDPASGIRLSVEAAGGVPLYTYQWYQQRTGEEKGAMSWLLNLILSLFGSDASVLPEEIGDLPLTGQTSSELNATSAGTYYCVVTDRAGDTVTSEKADADFFLSITEQKLFSLSCHYCNFARAHV